jgi:hypothetical protein
MHFQRTLRIPDDGKLYPLPPGLGSFPLRHLQDYEEPATMQPVLLSPHSVRHRLRTLFLALPREEKMGAHPYFYFVPYQSDIQRALDLLREREFQAGHYHPAMRAANPPRYMFEMKFPPDSSWPSPGPKHGSIREAVDSAMEEGTGSILDLNRVTSQPDFGAVSPIPDGDLIKLFGTTKPTRELLETLLFPKRREDYRADLMELFWDRIRRGEGRYVILSAASEPSELFLVGYSWD